MKTVLFIGTFNVLRSKYAEAYFNYCAENTVTTLPDGGEQKLSERYCAISRGTRLDGRKKYPAHKKKWDPGISYSHYDPCARKLCHAELRDPCHIIAMYEPEHFPHISRQPTAYSPKHISGDWNPSFAESITYWNIPDLVGATTCLDDKHADTIEELRDEVEQGVMELIKKLARLA